MNFGFSLRHLLKTSAFSLVALWALGPLLTFLELIRPWQLGNLTNLFAAATPTLDAVIPAVSIIIAAQFGISIVIFLQGRFEIFLREHAAFRLRSDLFNRIMLFPPRFFEQHDSTASAHVRCRM